MRSRRRQARRFASIAALAATAASCGDLLLLWIAAGGDREWLTTGHYLGVLFIPLYAIGYRAVSRMLAEPAIFWIGMYASAIGAAIHGITGAAILNATVTSQADPFASLAPVLAYLIPLWLIVGMASAVGSFLQCRAVSASSRYPYWFAWANPLVLTLTLAAVAVPFASVARYLVPAAPNVAHVLYFTAVAVIAGRRQPEDLEGPRAETMSIVPGRSHET
jgi:hypothetical protein